MPTQDLITMESKGTQSSKTPLFMIHPIEGHVAALKVKIIHFFVVSQIFM